MFPWTALGPHNHFVIRVQSQTDWPHGKIASYRTSGDHCKGTIVEVQKEPSVIRFHEGGRTNCHRCIRRDGSCTVCLTVHELSATVVA